MQQKQFLLCIWAPHGTLLFTKAGKKKKNKQKNCCPWRNAYFCYTCQSLSLYHRFAQNGSSQLCFCIFQTSVCNKLNLSIHALFHCDYSFQFYLCLGHFFALMRSPLKEQSPKAWISMCMNPSTLTHKFFTNNNTTLQSNTFKNETNNKKNTNKTLKQ